MSGLEGGTVIGLKAGKERIEHFSPRYDDDIEPFGRLVPPEHFTRQPLGTVAIRCRAQLARGGYPQARRRPAVGHYEYRHEARVDP